MTAPQTYSYVLDRQQLAIQGIRGLLACLDADGRFLFDPAKAPAVGELGDVTPTERHALERTVDVLQNAEPFWLAGDIGAAVTTAGASLPNHVRFLAPLVMDWPKGLVWLEAPWTFGSHVIDAVSWAPMVMFPPGFEDQQADLSRMIRERPELKEQYPMGLFLEAYVKTSSGMMPVWSTAIIDGHSLEDDANRRPAPTLSDAADRENHPSRHELVRAMLSLFLWLQQRIVVAPRMLACRGTRRRLGDVHAFVRVVTLRQAERGHRADHGDGDVVEWSCRWLVRGHWRDQFYPSTGLHQPIWILPYAKGPDDAPFKASPQVFAVTR